MLNLDLDRDGKTLGWIYVQHSTNDSGAGRIEVPVLSIRNGSGPRVLCSAGVHGDEFEGQIVWNRLARMIEPQQVRGQLVIAPAVNAPSAIAGTRCSPLDDVNLNRVFPGSASGSPTMRIAHVFESELIKGSDYMIDLHGGGDSMVFLSGPTVTRSEDRQLMARQLELLRVFGAPRAYVFDESGGGAGGTLGACRRHGVLRLGTEFGGARVSPAGVELMHQGVLRVLAHLKVIDPILCAELPAPEAPTILRRRSAATAAYVFAPEDGLFVPAVELGAEIGIGEPLGELCWPERPERDPLPVLSGMDGVVIAQRRRGRGVRGDCLALIADAEDL